MSGGFADDFRRGMALSPRQLPCKYLYDERGARLFERICELAEYYPTRAELSVLLQQGAAIADALGDVRRLVELGAGAGHKTRALLAALPRVHEYVPIDIARQQLEQSAAALTRDLPRLRVRPLCADFSAELHLPTHPEGRTVVYFAGSTLGNFAPDEARTLLARIGRLAGADGAAIVTVDLKKDPAVLHRAYNDAEGVTAAFNSNLLVRANRELGANFALDGFAHYAFYDPRQGCVVMTLTSTRDQDVRALGEELRFAVGEAIVTELSYKFRLDELAALAASAGLASERAWLDAEGQLAVALLRPT